MPRSPRLWSAALLVLCNYAPVSAQGDGATPIVEYGVGLLATALVLLVVCWPAKRK